MSVLCSSLQFPQVCPWSSRPSAPTCICPLLPWATPQLAYTTPCPHVTIATSRPPTAWWQVCWVAWLFAFVRVLFRSLHSKHESVLWVIAINATLRVWVWLFDDDSIGFLSPAQEMLSASISQTRILQTCSVPHNMVNGANSLQGTVFRQEHESGLF